MLHHKYTKITLWKWGCPKFINFKCWFSVLAIWRFDLHGRPLPSPIPIQSIHCSRPSKWCLYPPLHPITKILCTFQDSAAVLGCAKFPCAVWLDQFSLHHSEDKFPWISNSIELLYWHGSQKFIRSLSIISNRCYIFWLHDDVIKWKHFPRYWPFVHRSPVNSPHKGQWWK